MWVKATAYLASRITLLPLPGISILLDPELLKYYSKPGYTVEWDVRCILKV